MCVAMVGVNMPSVTLPTVTRSSVAMCSIARARCECVAFFLNAGPERRPLGSDFAGLCAQHEEVIGRAETRILKRAPRSLGR